VTVGILVEDLYNKRGNGLHWALYVQLGFGLIYALYLLVNKTQNSKCFMAVKVLEEIALFVVFFVLIGNTQALGVTDKPYIPRWCVINGVIILL
jgi:hypothetical protein